MYETRGKVTRGSQYSEKKKKTKKTKVIFDPKHYYGTWGLRYQLNFWRARGTDPTLNLLAPLSAKSMLKFSYFYKINFFTSGIPTLNFSHYLLHGLNL